jgi:16S rRNA (guanine(527)-N(7))-methyltransferase RsmG
VLFVTPGTGEALIETGSAIGVCAGEYADRMSYSVRMGEREAFSASLTSACRGHGTVDEFLFERLWAHYQLLRRWNRAMNLTTVDEPEVAARRHYAECLIGAWALPLGSFRIADVGSGAGFPGWVVAAARAECEVHLIESQKKKAAFLREAADSLGNVRVYAVRAETFNEPVDWVVSRAVRWPESLAVASRLRASVCLWCGLADAAEAAKEGGWIWREPSLLPGLERACVLIGHCST